jgi:(1->4)-alpha-D-glucan 1-alpha-D-glucosylmutase
VGAFRATYRLQFGPGFGFAQAKEIVPYLARLGVSHVYASPVFRARPGSAHGYDVVDAAEISPELGGEAGLRELLAAGREAGLGWLQDIVPNHAAYHRDNPLLVDLLEHGPDSAYCDFFDLNWDHHYYGLQGRLLAPFLGGLFGRCLESGELGLVWERGRLWAAYYDVKLPLAPETWAEVLERAAAAMAEGASERRRLAELAGALAGLPAGEGPELRTSRARELRQELARLCQDSPAAGEALERAAESFRGREGDPASCNDLERLLNRQHFRLAFWKVATQELNYRRFFNINELICLRMEREEVFRRQHGLILELVSQGWVDGLRVDHVDGLHAPTAYLRRLRREAPDAYLAVEKILEMDEELPRKWPVQGTTGYRFLNHLNGLYCRPRGLRTLGRVYGSFAGQREDPGRLLPGIKKLIIDKDMMGDVDNLVRELRQVVVHDRYSQDLMIYGLKEALLEVLAQFPCYRSYLEEAEPEPSERRPVEQALQAAREARPELAHELESIGRNLTLRYPDYLPEDERAAWLGFVLRCQQFTGPLMAKGLEDTLLYRHHRLVSANEVGGAPRAPGVSPAGFHRYLRRRRARWPHSLNATATHDTKRGEDTRARINVLSEIPGRWERRLYRWSRLNRGHKAYPYGREAPDRNDEYLLYQILLGTWPWSGRPDGEYQRRIREYVIKSVREAKRHTGWLQPDEAYEGAYLEFVERLLDPGVSGEFLGDFASFAGEIAHYGALNSLSQTAVKLTAPGVPDLYQGCELWDLSLVDPDNRRPVDYAARGRMLEELEAGAGEDPAGLAGRLLEAKPDGRAKLFLVHRLLGLRRRRPGLFARGDHRGLDAGGRRRANLVAFARSLGGRWLVVAAPRFATDLVGPGQDPLGPEVWGDTWVQLPGRAPLRWRDAICGHALEASGRRLAVGRALAHFPAAALIGEEE